MLQRGSIIREGIVAGLIGAAAVAAWFLIVDVIAGRPFFTPAALGSAAFFGLRDPATVTVGLQSVLGYTLIHVLLFLVVGVIASAMLAEVSKTPHFAWLLIEFFIVFEFGFYAAVAVAFTPLLERLAWISVAMGNLVAAITMGYYFWHAHPAIGARVRNVSHHTTP